MGYKQKVRLDELGILKYSGLMLVGIFIWKNVLWSHNPELSTLRLTATDSGWESLSVLLLEHLEKPLGTLLNNTAIYL